MTELTVSIEKEGSTLRLRSDIGDMRIESSAPAQDLMTRGADFAMWYFLPLAMRLGRNLTIDGYVSDATLANAREMSFVWDLWLGGHFHPVETARTLDTPPPTDTTPPQGDLLFFSGGIDSTYTLLKRKEMGLRQDILTVHGMDYGTGNESKFQHLVNATRDFRHSVSQRHLILKSDAYDLYRKFRCNPKTGHVTHIFSLAGAGFLHDRYARYGIASDMRLDQQFQASPWGSNTATNALFRSDTSHMFSLDDDVRRSQKLPLIAASELALSAVSFCKDESIRPENCGQCGKCIRTKLMFLARLGQFPPVFRDAAIPRDWFEVMGLKKPMDRVWMSDLLFTAIEQGTRDKIPQYDAARRYFDQHAPAAPGGRLTRLFKR